MEELEPCQQPAKEAGRKPAPWRRVSARAALLTAALVALAALLACRKWPGSPVRAAPQEQVKLAEAQIEKGCSDDPPDWTSKAGKSCAHYAEAQLCTASGGYGKGWRKVFGTWGNYRGKGNKTAVEACCACGGGIAALRAEVWIVVTSINAPTSQVKRLDAYAAKFGWAMVVVGDVSGPKDWPYGALNRTKFLSIEEQEKLPFQIVKLIPTKSYTRKNIGYLWAMQHGAKVIYDTDDDNELIMPISEGFILPSEDLSTVEAYMAVNGTGGSPATVNPYPFFGQPTLWPRGYPLGSVQASLPEYHRQTRRLRPWVQQGVVNGDPDMDAIFRLTRYPKGARANIRFDPSNVSLALPPGTLAPFNSQNTLFWREAFHLMLIPTTVSFRACDIWRGYFAQLFLWAAGGQLLFVGPSAVQHRNPHNYMDDFMDETDVYTKMERFVTSIRTFTPSQHGRNNVGRAMMDFARAMESSNLWQSGDVELMQAWLADLKGLGISFGDDEALAWDWENTSQQWLEGLAKAEVWHPKHYECCSGGAARGAACRPVAAALAAAATALIAGW